MAQELITLKNRIAAKELLLGIIGLGYVGLPLSLTFLRRDVSVLGFDLDKKKIAKLNSGESYIKHIPAEKQDRG